MSFKARPLNQVNEEAIRLLSQGMGVADTARFIRHLSLGSGNYTEERRALFGDLSLSELMDEIRARRAEDTAETTE